MCIGRRVNVSEIRKEVLDCIAELSDGKLVALMPILQLLIDDMVVLETNLTDEEKDIIRSGREEYRRGSYVPL